MKKQLNFQQALQHGANMAKNQSTIVKTPRPKPTPQPKQEEPKIELEPKVEEIKQEEPKAKTTKPKPENKLPHLK